MPNIANIEKLKYCDCRIGNNATCGSIATYSIKMKSKKNTSEVPLNSQSGYRCETHKQKSTTGKRVFEFNPFNQIENLTKVTAFLRSLIGKNISSKHHTARELEVKYVKDNGGVMCFQNHSKQWKFVYYHQIECIL